MRPRRPSPEPSPYVTRAGHDALQAELKNLWKHTRPALVQRVAEAAAMGDRSENAEYIYGKKQLRETDRRIAYLSRRLDQLKVVERAPPDRSRVFFGAHVELARTRGVCAVAAGPAADSEAHRESSTIDAVQTSCEDAGAVRRYQLVGPDEADAAAGRLSIDSPVASSLLRKQTGALVSIGGETWRLVAIRYGENCPSRGGYAGIL